MNINISNNNVFVIMIKKTILKIKRVLITCISLFVPFVFGISEFDLFNNYKKIFIFTKTYIKFKRLFPYLKDKNVLACYIDYLRNYIINEKKTSDKLKKKLALSS